MEVTERDPATGRETTGHEWNGIKELDTPVPRGVLMFLIITHLWAIAWWFLVPAWPLGTTYTRGLLGVDQRTTVEARVVEGQRERAPWTARLETEPYDVIMADEALMQTVRRHRTAALRRQLRRLSRPRRQGRLQLSRPDGQ